MTKTFYEDFQCVVKDLGGTCDWFDVRTSVKQRYSMSGFLFLMDWVIRRIAGHGENGIRWKFDDLDFADDVTSKSRSRKEL